MTATADKESKTEAATPRRIEDARKQGRTPVSREVGQAASVAGVLASVVLVARALDGETVGRLAAYLDRPGDFRLESGQAALDVLVPVLVLGAAVVAAPLIVLTVLSLLSSLIQNPLQLVAERIRPDPSRLSPGRGLERIFGGAGRVEFLKSAAKVTMLAAILHWYAVRHQAELPGALQLDPRGLPSMLAGQAMQLLLCVLVALAILAAADAAWGRLRWRAGLRMTRQEVKDEQKQAEGDPAVRARQRALARERARRRMMAGVPRATIVVANPTHYAVALRYVREETAAPVVVARGMDNLALRIRALAAEHGIPVVEDKALARSLYAAVALDRPIPPEFYRAVAEIILFLMARSGEASVARPEGALPPSPKRRLAGPDQPDASDSAVVDGQA